MIDVKKVLALFLTMLGLVVGLVIFHSRYNPVVGMELKSTRFQGQITLAGQDRQVLAKDLANDEAKRAKGCFKYQSVLVVKHKKGTVEYFIGEDNLVYDASGQRVQLTAKSLTTVKKLQKRLNAMSPYGDMVPWPKADKLFLKYATAVVQDVDTGLCFRVQRRAGREHADVQPLTARDSKIMKRIYDGQWSWRRKAILVKVNGHKLAASMNGMPHGAGAIRGNQFPGHFCIHFYGCKTHSGEVNLEHQIMVWKAAGNFNKITSELDPKKCVEVFFVALSQGDPALAANFYSRANPDEVKAVLKNVQWVTLSNFQIIDKDVSVKTDLVRVRLKFAIGLWNGAKNNRRDVTVTLHREGEGPRWKFQARELRDMLN